MTDSIIAKQSVLIIEDEATQLRILQKQLEGLGFNVLTAANGNEGIQIWRENIKVRIVITDLEMPEGDGYDVIKFIRKSESRHTYIMILTNMEAKDSLLEGLSLGADDFVQKPIIRQELDLRLKAAKRLLRLEDHDNLVANLARFAAERTGELDVHLTRTKEYCALLATDLCKNHPELGLTAEVVEDLANSSVMHDLGKICIPDALLHKRGNYTAEEQKTIESHTLRGGEIFQGLYKDTSSIFLRLGYEMVLGHHEMWDGSGYPFGKKETETPLSARILAVADTYDDIRSRKPYKDPFPASYAESTIVAGKGKQFDPMVVDAFIRNKDAFVEINDKYPQS